MVVFELIFQHQTIVSVKETSPKNQNGVNTLSKMVKHKKLKIVYISNHTILFKYHLHVVQILIK